MKTHTSAFKENIKKHGKEIDSIITYQLEGETIELEAENFNSITPHYQGAILKSVMKQLDIDSKINIPIGTELNYQFGIKVGNSYEYLDYGNYIVYSSEKQEDTNSYKIVCYDKMLYSMKDYENIGVTYPITIRNYINAICTHLGLTFANSSDTFANYDKEISNELYLSSDGTSLDYTFRDVLDELAQVTASTICINDDDELEIRYISNTQDTIDEEYLKNVNVNFGEKFGPVNVIVLSRSAGSDNVYYPAILPQNPYELKISDNQIMNGNNRSEFLPDIYNKLNGLEYYTNDFISTGICYYNLCDRYNVTVGENIYSCVMFNDEVNVTQGLEEHIYTDLPKETETDYRKADTTDRKINQAYIMVDKQNQVIQSLINQSVYISNTINGVGSVTLENAYEGRLYELSIKGQMSLLFPQSQDNIYGSSLVPSETLLPTTELLPSSSVPYQNEVSYPSDTLHTLSSSLLVDDVEYPLNFGFLNYIDNDICDEFIYHDGEYKVVRRVGIDEDGNKYPLENEFIDNIGFIDIQVKSDSTIALKAFGNMIYKAEYLLNNEYTDVFATKVDLSSSITQTAEEINLEVSKKTDKDEIISTINQSAEQVQINANKISLEGKEINMTSDNIAINSTNFSVDKDGNMDCSNANITGGNIELTGTENVPKLRIVNPNYTDTYTDITSGKIQVYNNGNLITNLFGSVGSLTLAASNDYKVNHNTLGSNYINNLNETVISLRNTDGNITCVSLTQTSLEKSKKNFKKYSGALKEVMGTDIYKYNLKDEKDTDKKHLGFVIGDNYNYSSEITSIDEDGNEIGVDNYSMTSLCLQAIKEQQEIIESLKKRIEKLEESDK